MSILKNQYFYQKLQTQRWAVFISGRGSNLSASVECVLFGPSIDLVVSSCSEAYGLKKAKRYGIPTKVLSHRIDWQDLLQTLHIYRISKIFLAGFMKILPSKFIHQWQKPIVNIHPSLLPSYPGLHSIKRSFEDQAVMGCSLHKVITKVDQGEILFSAGIPQVSSLEMAEFLIHIQEQTLGRKLFQTQKGLLQA